MEQFNFDNEEENLELTLNENKFMLDNAYYTTLKKYNTNQANGAMIDFLLNNSYKFFTNDNNARENMRKLLSHYYEIEQILMDFAISSYLSNNMDNNISEKDIIAYANDKNAKLNYDPIFITKMIALASSLNPYWTVNLLACNQNVKKALVQNFINERYILDKKDKLDNSIRLKIIKLKDGKRVTISKYRLNRHIKNMIHDESPFKTNNNQKR